MRSYVRAFAAAASILVTASAVPAAAETSPAQVVADLFKGGKPLRIVLGSAPGQDYDLWARFIARHLGRHVPGSPTIVVQNMPGAGDMLATNYLYNVAPRDGTVWGSVSRNIPNAGFQGFPGVRYDATKFTWIGSPEMTNRGCFAMAWAKVKKAADLFENELIVGGLGAGATVTETPILLRGLLGMKFKVVGGYVRPQDAVLAMERGELEGVCQTLQSFTRAKPDWIKSGTANVLFTGEKDRVPGINAPTIFEFAKTEEQRQVLAFLASTLELGRPIMMPPEVPPATVQVMRRAFDAMIDDPLFREEAKKINVEITHKTGEEIEALIMRAAATPPEVIAKASKLGAMK